MWFSLIGWVRGQPGTARTPGEYAAGHIPNAINIDWLGNNFYAEIEKLDTLKPIFIA